MIRNLTTLLIAALVAWLAYRAVVYWRTVSAGAPAPIEMVSPDALPGLSPGLTDSYQAARDDVATLRKWLEDHANSSELQDPRKASIQLDYVLMVSRDDPGEAKRVFAEVKQRVGQDSPVYPRVKKLRQAFD